MLFFIRMDGYYCLVPAQAIFRPRDVVSHVIESCDLLCTRGDVWGRLSMDGRR